MSRGIYRYFAMFFTGKKSKSEPPSYHLAISKGINIPRVAGGISASGIALPITGEAQVRFKLACQPCKEYLLPVGGP